MTELAPLDNYQGSEPITAVFPVNVVNFGGQATLFTLGEGAVWRIRVLQVSGFLSGNMGGVKLGLGFDLGAAGTGPWSNGNDNSWVGATVPQVITNQANFAYTWSTETTSAYYSDDDAQGFVSQAGIPLMFLPAGTQIDIVRTIDGGFNGDQTIRDGFMQIEKFPPTAVQAGDTDLAQVFLLPQGR